jgi:cyclic pyranopterin phosphate synthase
MTVLDRLERPLRDLRISVTDRCNMRCRYCMPRETFGRDYAFMAHEQLLSFEEIARLSRAFAALGVRKLRLTGGEPLLRREIERLVAMLAAVPGIEDVALTTNGALLAAKADALARAGLERVTVSLDALDEQTFKGMGDTRLSPARVLAGIDAALAAGLSPLKVNMVVRRHMNEREVLRMADRFRHSGAVLRFIEYMDVGATNGWRREDVVASEEIRAAIEGRWALEALPAAHPGEVASRYRYRDGAGEIGFVHSVTNPFCGACNRARLSADGRLYTCLFATDGHDLRGLLREGASEERVRGRLREIWEGRRDRYSAERPRAEREKRVEMSFIGG